MTTISQITQRYLEELANFQPVWATALGISGHEGEVADLSEERIQRHLEFLKKIKSQVRSSVAPLRPSAVEAIERELLHSELKLRESEWKEQKKYQQDPSLYVGELIYGLWYLFLRIPSKSLVVESVLRRLKSSETVLRAAEFNLKNPPRLWTQIAIEEAQGYLAFLKDVHRELLRLAPRRRLQINQALTQAEETGQSLLKFFRSLLKKSRGNFSVGARHFDFLLKNYHRYTLNAAQLLKIGREQMAEVGAALREAASRIRPGVPWPKLVAQIKKSHPSRLQLLKAYREETRRLRRYIDRQQIVTLPADESLQVIETPAFTRNTIPYAAYVDPPMFGGKNRGTFFVTPVTAKNQKQERELLEEHNFGALRVTALHEGYPGHHLQFAKQFHARGSMMKISMCSSFYEGWALYCEEMMGEAGYYDAETRLMQLKDKLWRACRVVVDVSLHTGRMTDAQAVKFLAKEAVMSAASARADVNWYTMRPTVPQSYLTGMLQIKKLREDYRKKLGDKFTSKKFHDEFLQFGAIPIPLVRKALLS